MGCSRDEALGPPHNEQRAFATSSLPRATLPPANLGPNQLELVINLRQVIPSLQASALPHIKWGPWHLLPGAAVALESDTESSPPTQCSRRYSERQREERL